MAPILLEILTFSSHIIFDMYDSREYEGLSFIYFVNISSETHIKEIYRVAWDPSETGFFQLVTRELQPL